jgi:hypothetical protein
MSTKKTEDRPEYDFRGGVRGKHTGASKDPIPHSRQHVRKPQTAIPEAKSPERSVPGSSSSFDWTSGPLGVQVDLEDKEAVRRALESEGEPAD